jgi:hypothetical protein
VPNATNPNTNPLAGTQCYFVLRATSPQLIKGGIFSKQRLTPGTAYMFNAPVPGCISLNQNR